MGDIVHDGPSTTPVGLSGALQDAVRPWQPLLHLLPIGVFVCDHEGLLVQYNRHAAELWGRSPPLGSSRVDEVVKVHGCDAVPPSTADVPIAEVLRTGEGVRDREMIIERADGTRLTLLANIDPLRDPDGKVIGGVCCFQDISARKSPYQDVRQSQELLRAIVETTPECVKIVDADGTLLYMNEAGLEMVEASAGAVEGASAFELIAPEDRETWRANHERVCRGEKLRWEFDIVGLRGTRRRLETQGAPLRLPDGKIVQLAVTRDVTQRRASEAALRDSERHFRDLLDALPTAVYTTDTKGRVTFYNQAAVELAGRRPELGDEWCVTWRLYQPDGTPLPHDQCPMAVALKESRPVRGVEAVAERPDGTRVPFIPYPTPLRDASGRLIGAVNMMVDLTERKQAEAVLRESEQRFRRVFEQSPLGKATAGPDFRFRAVNPALCHMLDYAEEELVGRSFLDFVHPEDRETCLANGRALIAGEVAQIQLEERFLRKSGDPVWVSVTVGPIRDAAGSYLYGLAIFEDIDERRRITQALQQSEQRLRELNDSLEQQAEQRARQLASSRAQLQAFFHNSPDWLTLVRASPEGLLTYVDVNATCEEAYGLKRYQLIGRTVEEVLGATGAELPVRNIRECLRTGKSQRYTARRTMAGRTRTIDVVCTPVPDQTQDGDRLVITTARDITEREELEAQLRQAQKMEIVGQLTGGVAHDFNNLLTAIIGNLDLLETRLKGDARAIKQMQAAQRAAERGAKLIGQLLAFSRRQHLRPETVDVNAIVQGMSDLLARTIGSSVGVRTVLAADLWSALVDPTQIEIAVLNLAINARDAMQLGGTVLIETANVVAGTGTAPREIGDRDCILISVRDTGTGMSEEVLARAIEPFFTTKEYGKGSGLGLSQVYGVARQSGGTLDIESSLGAGTTVRLYLPRAAADHGTRDGDIPPQAEPQISGRILVVDDDVDVREIAVQMLRQSGYAVTEVESGQLALEALARGEIYDLLVVDVAMPGLSGIETVRRVQERWPLQRTLLMTGYANAGVFEQGSGSDRVLKKPFKLVDLADAVDKALRAAQSGAGGNVVPLRQRR
jgi:PAS domain S-box-containing protein